MEALEALLMEEEIALASEAKDETLGARAEFLPHLKHQLYANLLTRSGQLILAQQSNNNDPAFINPFSAGHEFLTQLIEEDIKKLERKYRISISEEEVEVYLLAFAGRILEYAWRRLPGMMMEHQSGQFRPINPESPENYVPRVVSKIEICYMGVIYNGTKIFS